MSAPADGPAPGATALERLNAGEAAVVRRDLAACLDAPEWVEAVLAARPFATPAAALQAGDEAASALPPEQVLRALHAHPRIGERPTGAGASAAASRREQAGVAADDATARALAAGNTAYEERFGHVFLVRAAGRSAEDVLAALRQRLDNDPATEVAVAGDQLREIALLRLRALLAVDEVAS